MNLSHKILKAHLVHGELIPGADICISIDQTLMQDATGTMAMLEFEALGLDDVKTELSAQYVDHNLLQTDNKNADDHRYLQTVSERFGIYFSRPGNGVSHQVHMEQFGIPGKTLLGSDSHTPGAAGVSMLAIGAGGLDVAMAMAGQPFCFPCPKILGVKLTGKLSPWVSAKDVILEMLRRYDVKGGVGKIVEYYGPGVKNLRASGRMVIGNMGAELGATSSVFPSDEITKNYLEAHGRGDKWIELLADEDAEYDEYAEIDLATVEPLIALPSSPGKVVPVKDVAGKKVDQVIVGSSANSGYRDLMVAAKILEGRMVHLDTTLHVNPGSRHILENVMNNGGIVSLVHAGARISEPGCLGCIGMGQAPGTGQISLRTVPRNFPGRSGTKGDQVYLCSPETAAAAALKGVITDPRDLAKEMAYPDIQEPDQYLVDEACLIGPLGKDEKKKVKIIRGPNIQPFPDLDALEETLSAQIVLKVGDNISTDEIMPAGNKILPLRSNITAISEYVFYPIDPEFHQKCKDAGNCVVVGGENYGQGSSREHAALAPRFLGVRAKIVKSFARIHKANLCNFGVLPLLFKNPDDFEIIQENNQVDFPDVRERIKRGDVEIPVKIGEKSIITLLEVSERQRFYLLEGAALNYVRKSLKR
ncbi:MAG: aconitate hydratase [Candidatus Aminicenantes bacterium]|nr:aconitate hydratase [Candidatus Aminicenantes bacterium]